MCGRILCPVLFSGFCHLFVKLDCVIHVFWIPLSKKTFMPKILQGYSHPEKKIPSRIFSAQGTHFWCTQLIPTQIVLFESSDLFRLLSRKIPSRIFSTFCTTRLLPTKRIALSFLNHQNYFLYSSSRPYPGWHWSKNKKGSIIDKILLHINYIFIIIRVKWK